MLRKEMLVDLETNLNQVVDPMHMIRKSPH